jgi:hypothetical protein
LPMLSKPKSDESRVSTADVSALLRAMLKPQFLEMQENKIQFRRAKQKADYR